MFNKRKRWPTYLNFKNGMKILYLSMFVENITHIKKIFKKGKKT